MFYCAYTALHHNIVNTVRFRTHMLCLLIIFHYFSSCFAICVCMCVCVFVLLVFWTTVSLFFSRSSSHSTSNAVCVSTFNFGTRVSTCQVSSMEFSHIVFRIFGLKFASVSLYFCDAELTIACLPCHFHSAPSLSLLRLPLSLLDFHFTYTFVCDAVGFISDAICCVCTSTRGSSSKSHSILMGTCTRVCVPPPSYMTVITTKR